MRKGIECPKCHGIYDPGEMINGICIDCREQERLRIIRRENYNKIQNSPFVQMELRIGG